MVLEDHVVQVPSGRRSGGRYKLRVYVHLKDFCETDPGKQLCFRRKCRKWNPMCENFIIYLLCMYGPGSNSDGPVLYLCI